MRQSLRKSKKNYKSRRIIADINITPFVDVLLILLIIFMVTAPMMSNGFNVNLPKSVRNQLNTGEEHKQILLSIDKKANLYLDEELVSQRTLTKKLQGYNKATTQFFIKADKAVAYNNVIKIMSMLSSMGFVNISLVTDVQ